MEYASARHPAATAVFVALLRLEGLGLLVAAVAGYVALGGGWQEFAALFLVPDLGMAAYLAGPRAGAFGYNATHSEIGPASLGVAALLAHAAPVGCVALIWAAHIGFDRALGYGLKSTAGFGSTHLGAVGRRAR